MDKIELNTEKLEKVGEEDKENNSTPKLIKVLQPSSLLQCLLLLSPYCRNFIMFNKLNQLLKILQFNMQIEKSIVLHELMLINPLVILQFLILLNVNIMYQRIIIVPPMIQFIHV